MSSCFFITSNSPLKEVISSNTIINLSNPEENTISVYKMSYYEDVYSGMNYANEICYNQITKLQVNQILDYIKEVLVLTDTVELWRVWIPDYGNPITKTLEISINDLSASYLYNYLINLKKSPYFTVPLHEEDDENNIHYKLKINR